MVSNASMLLTHNYPHHVKEIDRILVSGRRQQPDYCTEDRYGLCGVMFTASRLVGVEE